MVCRSNPASSVVIALARNGTWLDDAQVQSVFHRLRHDPVVGATGGSGQRPDQIERIFAAAQQRIRTDPTLRTQRRQGLLARLDRSRSQTGGLADDTVSAMSRLEVGVRQAQWATEARLHEMAGQLGMSGREIREEFVRLRSQAPPGRQARATTAELDDLGRIPSDPATRHAIAELQSRTPDRPPVRLVQRWLPVRPLAAPGGNQADAGAATSCTEIGLSDLSNRVELRTRDGGLEAYDTTPIHNLIGTTRPDQGTVDRIRFHCRRVARVEETAYAVRCDDCGRFVGDLVHDCPVRRDRTVARPAETVPVPGGSLCLPATVDVAAAVEANDGEPVRVQTTCVFDAEDLVVLGSVTVRPGAQVITDPGRRSRQDLDIDDAGPGELVCSACGDSCLHVAQTRNRIRTRLAGTGQDLTAQEATERAAALVCDRPGPATGPTLRSASDSWEPAGDQVGEGTSFVDNPEAFRAVIRAAGRDRVVPFRRENVLAGYAAGTRFGIELEFNATRPGVPQEAARRLAAAGIVADTTFHGYHHMARRRGYDGTTWVLESDSSVPNGGELVSTVESDQPASWDRLDRACQIIRDVGGTTAGAGSHTNVSCDNFTPEHAWRMIRLFRTFEDDLFRMGRTPGSRRDQAHYARPFADPGPEAWQDGPSWLRYNRYQVVNFCNAFNGPGSARLEFRFPDASHQPGVIQAQVQLAAAMTGWVRDHHDLPAVPRPVGTSLGEGWTNRLMGSSPGEWADRTRPVRTLIDTLFRRDADRQQMALLWARGRYQRPVRRP